MIKGNVIHSMLSIRSVNIWTLTFLIHILTLLLVLLLLLLLFTAT